VDAALAEDETCMTAVGHFGNTHDTSDICIEAWHSFRSLQFGIALDWDRVPIAKAASTSDDETCVSHDAGILDPRNIACTCEPCILMNLV
jgi:hypothetical protein